jgi:hypothetical protein
MTALKEYQSLLEEVDSQTGRISRIPGVSIRCAASCAQCCVPFSILPIEAHALLACGNARRTRAGSIPGRCPLLTAENLCSVYEARPLVCRVRGFPVYYINSEGEPAMESCPNNLFPPETGAVGAVHLELWNALLYRINLRFCMERGLPRGRILIGDVSRAAFS